VLSVNEIFYSIQGESTYAGKPCVFVRLAGCDLRCSWCDTAYAFNEGRKMSVDDVLQHVDQYGSPLVEVTGGEPLLQEDVYPLMERLLDTGRTVLLETGGQIDVSRVPGGVVKVLDVKCPASGESDKVEWNNIDRLGSRDQVKFVIQDRDDYELRAISSRVMRWIGGARPCCSLRSTA
jgi:7-carboxy-7-deazaguanine synthase